MTEPSLRPVLPRDERPAWRGNCRTGGFNGTAATQGPAVLARESRWTRVNWSLPSGPVGFPVLPYNAGHRAEDDHCPDGDEPGQDAEDGADRSVGLAVGGDG